MKRLKFVHNKFVKYCIVSVFSAMSEEILGVINYSTNEVFIRFLFHLNLISSLIKYNELAMLFDHRFMDSLVISS